MALIFLFFHGFSLKQSKIKREIATVFLIVSANAIRMSAGAIRVSAHSLIVSANNLITPIRDKQFFFFLKKSFNKSLKRGLFFVYLLLIINHITKEQSS
ncbi:hypothetical protein FHS60_000535 [Alloprevotella rava]|uniref:Uncharacterized protein n=1 Tax=Alloprevotella rava TaxID=671218 RepID=A0A7W5UIK4_9BACT|nr:hypothetical protein [Alloprevotella rava]